MKTFFLIEAGRALQIVTFRPAITTVLFQRFSVSFSCSYFTCCTSQLLRENWLFKFLTAFDHVIRASNDLSTMRFMIMYIYVYIYIYLYSLKEALKLLHVNTLGLDLFYG